LGDPWGRRLLDRIEQLDSKARNENSLIHGSEHVTEKRFCGYRKKVLDALDVHENAIPSWPSFRP
jgi:hypothetical protein